LIVSENCLWMTFSWLVAKLDCVWKLFVNDTQLAACKAWLFCNFFVNGTQLAPCKAWLFCKFLCDWHSQSMQWTPCWLFVKLDCSVNCLRMTLTILALGSLLAACRARLFL
jgi:hypothetical protein